MSSVRRIDEGQPDTDGYQLGVLEMEDGGFTVFYDKENPDAWLQADEDHCIMIDGRWR